MTSENISSHCASCDSHCSSTEPCPCCREGNERFWPGKVLKIPENSEVKTQAQIAQACEEVKQMLLEKNLKYGNSALQPARIFSKANSLEQLRVRIDDKLSRLLQGQENTEDEDVLLDLIGYLILLLIGQRQPKPSFAEGVAKKMAKAD